MAGDTRSTRPGMASAGFPLGGLGLVFRGVFGPRGPQKTGARNRAEALRMAEERGWL